MALETQASTSTEDMQVIIHPSAEIQKIINYSISSTCLFVMFVK
jgi:hypothetical protein